MIDKAKIEEEYIAASRRLESAIKTHSDIFCSQPMDFPGICPLWQSRLNDAALYKEHIKGQIDVFHWLAYGGESPAEIDKTINPDRFR